MNALEAEGRQAMEQEPLIKRGLRTFELRKWGLREGRIDISLRASVSRFSLYANTPLERSSTINRGAC